MNAPLKVAIARQYRTHCQPAFVHGLLDRIVEWSGVADAGGAAVTHQIKTQRVKRRLQSGFLQIVRNHF